MFEPGVLLNGRYRVLSLLGEGGMGAVYKVEDQPLEKRVLALKILKGTLCEPDFIERFKREFLVLTQLKHANVAEVFDFGRLTDRPEFFFTSEFVDGVDLYTGTEGLPVEMLLRICVEICRGLEYVHSRGLVHHDLKPENILVRPSRPEELSPLERLQHAFGAGSEDVFLKIIDFGFINLEKNPLEKVVGSPHYIAPEKIRSLPCDRRSDLYALGVILYRLFTRAFPFKGATILDVLHEHLSVEPLPPAELRPGLPPFLDDLILRLLAKDPAERPANALEVVREIGGAGAHEAGLEASGSHVGYIRSGGLVEREPQMAALTDALEALRETPPRGGAFLFLGEEGTGKTRLLTEFKYLVEVQSVPWIEAAAGEGGPPLLRVLGSIRSALSPSDPEFEAWTAVSRAAEEGSPALEGTIVESIASLLANTARRRPLVLAMEGLHDPDRFLFTLLQALLPRIHENGGSVPILLAATARGSELSPDRRLALDGSAEAGRLARFPIENLSRGGLERLLTSMFGALSPPPGFLDALHEKTRGSPLFLRAVLEALAEAGGIVRGPSGFGFSPDLGRIPLPATLAEVLSRRVALLSDPARALLKALAVRREPAPAALLTEFLGGGVEEPLREALDRQLAAILPGRDRAAAVATERLRDLLLRGIPEKEREELHARWGAFLEGRAGPDPLRRAADLAPHFVGARDARRALRYAMPAAERWRRLRAPREAIALLEGLLPILPAEERAARIRVSASLAALLHEEGETKRAETLVERILGEGGLSDTDRVQLLRRLGEMALSLSAPARARGRLEEALKALGEARRESLPAVPIHAALAEALERLGCFEEAAQAADRALRILKARALDPALEREAIRCRSTLGGVRYGQGRHDEAIEHFEAGISLARRFNDTRGYAELVIQAAGVHDRRGDFGKAREGLAAATQILRERFSREDRALLARALNALTQVHLRAGDLSEAFASNREALRTAEETGDPLLISRALKGLGMLSHRLWYFQNARKCLTQSLEIAQEIGDRVGAAFSELLLGELSFTLSRFDEAEKRSDEAVKIAQQVGQAYLIGRTLLFKGILAQAKAAPGADRLLKSAESVFQRGGNQREVAEMRIAATNVLLERGERVEAGEVARIREFADSLPSVDLGLEAALLQGKWLVHSGRAREALPLLEGLVAEAEERKHRSLLIKSLMAWGLAEDRAGNPEGYLRIARRLRPLLDEVLSEIPEADRPLFLEGPELQATAQAFRLLKAP